VFTPKLVSILTPTLHEPELEDGWVGEGEGEGEG